jgi:hypothetical protein
MRERNRFSLLSIATSLPTSACACVRGVPPWREHLYSTPA